MRRSGFASLTLLSIIVCLSASHGQSTLASANVGSAGSNDNRCAHTQELNGRSKATCSGTFDDPNGGTGAGTSAAISDFSGMAIGGGVTMVRRDGGHTISMQAQAQAQLADLFTLSGLPDNSFFLISNSLLAIPGGLSQATILLQVDISSNGMNSECTAQSFGGASCTSRIPVSAAAPTVSLVATLAGSAAASCGPPDCGGASSSFSGGFKAPGGGSKVLVVRVVDASGNPIDGVTITAASGHKYPTRFASTTTLTASVNPSIQGQAVTLTATVASFGRSSNPTGQVVFKDVTTGTTLGKASLVGGVATFTTSHLSAGTHTLNAHYIGDVWSAASQSGLSQVVN
jgi:hypothetical protein